MGGGGEAEVLSKALLRAGSPTSLALPVIFKAVNVYTGLLESSPLATKAATCAVIGALGNVIAQVIQQVKGIEP